MIVQERPCAACGSEDYVKAEISAMNNTTTLHVRWCGIMQMLICKNCGTMRVSNRDLQTIQRVQHEMEERGITF